jgi:hypothetical protein
MSLEASKITGPELVDFARNDERVRKARKELDDHPHRELLLMPVVLLKQSLSYTQEFSTSRRGML